jgi:hypothetical protein
MVVMVAVLLIFLLLVVVALLPLVVQVERMVATAAQELHLLFLVYLHLMLAVVEALPLDLTERAVLVGEVTQEQRDLQESLILEAVVEAEQVDEAEQAVQVS